MTTNTRPTLLVAGGLMLLSLIILTVSCTNGDDSGNGEPQLVLRSYAVAPELAPELKTILNSLLERGEDEAPVGRVDLGPSGQLLVAAPEPVHEGVEQIIDDLERAKPEPAPMITMTYWILSGRPAPATEWSPRLGELESVLGAIASAEGSTAFSLLEKVKIHSLSGEAGSNESRLFWIRQRATAREGRVLADLRFNHKGLGSGGMETRISLEPDQLLVLGQSALPNGLRERGDDTEANLYIVVRPEIADGDSR